MKEAFSDRAVGHQGITNLLDELLATILHTGLAAGFLAFCYTTFLSKARRHLLFNDQIFACLCFKNRVLLCSQVDLELLILLSQPPECWAQIIPGLGEL